MTITLTVALTLSQILTLTQTLIINYKQLKTAHARSIDREKNYAAGPVAQQHTPVLGHASRSTLLSAVCRSAGHVLATNAALSIEE